jgi:dTDP-D-glucose 4,6-dehydratase
MGDQPGDVRRTSADVAKAERLFGYRPSMPFPDGIRRFATWYRTQHEPAVRMRRRRVTNGAGVAHARPASLQPQPSIEVSS